MEGVIPLPERYKISELAERAGVTKRTIHYYIGKGLLPPPEGAGVGSTYGEEHLVKVLLVKKLQTMYLPLENIRRVVSGLGTEKARLMLEGEVNLNQGTDIEEIKPDTLVDGLFLAGDYPASPVKAFPVLSAGREYKRIDLGQGIELHCPVRVYEKNCETIGAIERYARRLLEEK